jgi:hypothetical protein
LDELISKSFGDKMLLKVVLFQLAFLALAQGFVRILHLYMCYTISLNTEICYFQLFLSAFLKIK